MVETFGITDLQFESLRLKVRHASLGRSHSHKNSDRRTTRERTSDISRQREGRDEREYVRNSNRKERCYKSHHIHQTWGNSARLGQYWYSLVDITSYLMPY